MKKLLATVGLISVVLLAGCEGGMTYTGNIVTNYTDDKTGCEYLTSENGGITPRYEVVDGEQTIKGCE